MFHIRKMSLRQLLVCGRIPVAHFLNSRHTLPRHGDLRAFASSAWMGCPQTATWLVPRSSSGAHPLPPDLKLQPLSQCFPLFSCFIFSFALVLITYYTYIQLILFAVFRPTAIEGPHEQKHLSALLSVMFSAP